MSILKKIFFWTTILLVIYTTNFKLKAQDHSIARQWNEMLLTSIRNDFARPTVHARNLFHVSAAMFDVWAVFNPGKASHYLIGNNLNGFTSTFSGFTPSGAGAENAQLEEAISYAAFRILLQRFGSAPDRQAVLGQINSFMVELGYDPNLTSTDFSGGSAAALGNYIASQYLTYGQMDGAEEDFDYRNLYYSPVNVPLEPQKPGNPNITQMNRWQPLALESFIDQSGNVAFDAPEFLSAEWGNVFGFSLTEADKTVEGRNGDIYNVYNDPGTPPQIEEEVNEGENNYHWGFELVSVWGAHLDPADGVMWDISPGSIGNISDLPTDFNGHRSFYNEFDGGDPSTGRTMNPKTGQPYEQNIVLRGDYTRVLAEFWADGPDSETPPGHWFTLLNYVSDHDQVVKKFRGTGATLSDLEWDLKAYFILGGAMHDAAISAWSIKGWYDYIRPVSAIRAMADLGQRSDPGQPNYHELGITLKPGYIELVAEGDALAGASNEHLDKVKLYTWKGPDYIVNPETDVAGVDWVLAENWWPYQRPTFVTPPFAGYVSGHSTYSRAAAEVLTLLTGDEYFPGGLGEFTAPKDEFLVFEDGPSVDVTLQWATYRDASDQTSLSRIWGGIHPPADDIPGRIIGEKVGLQAFGFAESFFISQGVVTGLEQPQEFNGLSFGPNPVSRGQEVLITLATVRGDLHLSIHSPDGASHKVEVARQGNQIRLNTTDMKAGMYLIQLTDSERTSTLKLLVQH